MSSTMKNNKMTYIHIAIMFAIMFIVWNLPPFGMITELGMKVLGVFLGIVYGWIFIDLFWVSFMGFAMLDFQNLMQLQLSHHSILLIPTWQSP